MTTVQDTPPTATSESQPGTWGRFGGRFVPEALVGALDELEAALADARQDPAFDRRLRALLHDYGGRPTALYLAERLSAHAGGARIYLKREDLAHTGSHKLCNVLGQGLLAERMGKPRLIAETGAGQHGVATATIAALLGLDCVVYMGEEDTRRQRLNVIRMQLLGAEVVPVTSGTRTLKDVTNEALRDWVANVESTHYLLGSVVGPHPFPTDGARVRQGHRSGDPPHEVLDREDRLPDAVVACVGGGSNAMGAFHAVRRRTQRCVRLVGVEAGWSRCLASARALGHRGPPAPKGILHGARSASCCRTSTGRSTRPTRSRRDWTTPGVGPEHAWLADTGRADVRQRPATPTHSRGSAC